MFENRYSLTEMISFARTQNRRAWLRSSFGFGSIALSQLLDTRCVQGSDQAPSTFFHHAPRAKRVIFLFMMGGPSHLDMFDPKPGMQRMHGEPVPSSLVEAKKSATGGVLETVMASPRRFRAHGKCGIEISELLPWTAAIADEICVIRSMHCEQSNHDPAQLLLSCGSPLFGNPSMGSWINYGLGSECQDLPGYIVMLSDDGHGLEGAGASLWGNGFLPSTYRGVSFRSGDDPILFLKSPPGIDRRTQRARLDAIRSLNEVRLDITGDAEIQSRIEAYEMAFRMQSFAPKLLEFSDETEETLKMYGIDRVHARSFSTNCLLARRMVENGVRFVHLVHSSWDHHSDLNQRLENNCQITDQPAAALVMDLKRRGLLEDTLVIWAGEFGRTPMGEVRRGVTPGKEGRDHHPNAFSIWMAGGGIKSGYVHGKTDAFGFHVIESPVHVHDLQATILHLLGIQHERLTFRYAGRDFRLTDVSGKVVHDVIV